MMKHLRQTIYVFLILCCSVNSYAYKYLNKLTEWPFAPLRIGISPAPETIIFGNHSNVAVAPDGIIFWVVGDTLSIINAATMTQLSSVIIPTESYINSMFFDPESELLYLGAGRANKPGDIIKGGMMVYNVSDLNSTPVKIAYINNSTYNPGFLPDKNSTDSKEIPAIDGCGIAYFKGLVFLADLNFGLRVFTDLDPALPAPRLLSEISYPDPDSDGDLYISFKRCSSDSSCSTTGGFLNLKLIDLVFENEQKVYLLIHDYYWGLRFFDVTGLYITETDTSTTPHTQVIVSPDLNATNDDLIEVADKDLRTSLWIGSLSLVSGMAITEAADKDDTLYAYVSSTNSSLTQSVMGKLEIYLDKLYNTDPEYIFPYTGDIGDHPIINYGYATTPGFIGGFDISDGFSYAADGGKGLQIADMVSEPSGYDPFRDPKDIYEIIGGLESAVIDASTVTLSDAYSCAKDGDYTYLGTTSTGLHKINVDPTLNPPDPIHDLYLNSPLSTDAVSVDGSYMYTLDQDFGIRVFDITMDSYLSLKGIFDNNVDETGTPAPQTAYDIVASAHYAFIANGTNGLRVLNIANPTTPIFEIDQPVTGTSVDIDVLGQYAYIAAQDAGLAIIYVSDPSTPGEPAYIDTDGSAEGIFADGSFTYIADGTNGLVIADVTDKADPQPAGQINISGTSVSVAIDRLDINDDETVEILAYVVSDTGVHVVDVSDPLNPVMVSTWSTPDGTPTDIIVSGGAAYVAMGTDGIRILYLDLNLKDDDEVPIPVLREYPTSHYTGTDNAKALFTVNGYLYVADGKGGVSVLGMYDSTSDSDLGAHYPSSSSDSYCFISTLY